MDPTLQDLIDRYIDGTASAEEVQRLDDLVQRNEAVRKALLLGATMEVQLRRLLTNVEQTLPGSAPMTSSQRRNLSWRKALKYAAVLLVTAGGWVGAIFFASQYFALRKQCDNLPKATAEVHVEEKDSETDEPQVQLVSRDRVIETRGLVLALPEGDRKAMPISVGGRIPNGRRLWTCPWGGAAMRLADGSSMQLDRSTVVAFSESHGKRQLKVSQGVFFLTRQDAPQDHGITVLTDQAAIDVVDAQVAVAVDERRTLIEVAEGRVEVAPTPDGPNVTVPAGHYLIVGASVEPKVVEGRLAWRLEPAKRDAYVPTLP